MERRAGEIRAERVRPGLLTAKGLMDVMRRNYEHLLWLNEHYPSEKSRAALEEADEMLDRLAAKAKEIVDAKA